MQKLNKMDNDLHVEKHRKEDLLQKGIGSRLHVLHDCNGSSSLVSLLEMDYKKLIFEIEVEMSMMF
jgi:hypothetical protein